MSNNNCPLRCVGNYLYNMYVCVRNSCCPRYAVQEAVEELKYKLDVLEAKIAILYECDYVKDIEERLDAIEQLQQQHQQQLLQHEKSILLIFSCPPRF